MLTVYNSFFVDFLADEAENGPRKQKMGSTYAMDGPNADNERPNRTTSTPSGPS